MNDEPTKQRSRSCPGHRRRRRKPRLAECVPGMGPEMTDADVRDALAERARETLALAAALAEEALADLRRDTSLTDRTLDLVDYALDSLRDGFPELALAVVAAVRARQERQHAGLVGCLLWFDRWASAARYVAPDLTPALPRLDAFAARCRAFAKDRAAHHDLDAIMALAGEHRPGGN